MLWRITVDFTHNASPSPMIFIGTGASPLDILQFIQPIIDGAVHGDRSKIGRVDIVQEIASLVRG